MYLCLTASSVHFSWKQKRTVCISTNVGSFQLMLCCIYQLPGAFSGNQTQCLSSKPRIYIYLFQILPLKQCIIQHLFKINVDNKFCYCLQEKEPVGNYMKKSVIISEFLTNFPVVFIGCQCTKSALMLKHCSNSNIVVIHFASTYKELGLGQEIIC